MITILTALWIIGLYEITQLGQPLHFLRKILDKVGLKDGEARTWYYPVLYCPPCMSSLHGLLVWLTFGGELYLLPLHLIATYGLVSYIRNHWYD
jgi:hypothetical protein